MSDAVNKPAHYNQGSIECIEAMKIVLTPEEFRGYLKGNVFKYLWREKDKNGNEDLRKGKSYYDRLIELVDEYEQQKAADLQSLKDHPFGKLKEKAIKQSLNTEPPDGWRFLEVGEVIRKGDRYWFQDAWHDRGNDLVGCKYSVHHCQTIRRNRFEVGEKVVRVSGECVYKITAILDGGYYEMQTPSGYKVCLYAIDLAPYIEDAK